jgi:hypothetical protein
MNKQEPIAWAVIDSKGNVVELAKTRLAFEHDHIRQDDQIKKLYLSEPITLSNEEVEAISEAADSYDDGCNERCVKITATLRNLLERTKNNNEQLEQMKIAREIMKQDSECLRNLSKHNDDSTENFDS